MADPTTVFDIPADPGTLLGEINERLRRLLDATGKMYKYDHPVVEKLQNVLRQTTILQMLRGEYVVAVAGAPGAGKSTLMRLLYDLHNPDISFVSGRTGRGERLPIWIREMESVNAPTAFVHVYRWKGEHSGRIEALPIQSARDFERIAHDPRAADGCVNIMLELQVAPRVFDWGNSGFLLLPGLENYHLTDKRDTHWNQLIEFSLIAASRYLLVVDNVANYQELAAYEQFQQWFKDSQPLFVLPRSENESDGGERKKTALREKLGLSPKESDRIVCTGLNQVSEWTDELRATLRKYSTLDRGAEAVQLVQLAKLFDKVLYDVLSDIKLDAEQQFRTEHSPMENTLQEFMETHEQAAKKEEGRFMRRLEEALNRGADEFVAKAEKAYGATSIWETIGNFTIRKGRPSPEVIRKVETAVRHAWNDHLVEVTDRFNQAQLAEVDDFYKLSNGNFDRNQLSDAQVKDIKQLLRQLPKLSGYALMQQSQRAGFLSERIPQIQAEASTEESLLGITAKAAMAFVPAASAAGAAAAVLVVNHVIQAIRESELYNKKRVVSDTTRFLFESTLASSREDYTRLADELQEKIQSQLADHLGVESAKNDYLNIQLRINQLLESIKTVKEMANKRSAYGMAG